MRISRMNLILSMVFLSVFMMPPQVFAQDEAIQRINSTGQISEKNLPAVISKEGLNIPKQYNNMSGGLITLDSGFNLFPASKTLNLALDNIAVADVLRIISQEGKRNIIIDESVKGTISAELKNISLNEALKIILISKELELRTEGNNIFVASRPAMAQKGLNRKYIKTFKLNNSNAVEVAKLLEASVLNKGYDISDNIASTSGNALAAATNTTNNTQNAQSNETTTGLSNVAKTKILSGKVESVEVGSGFGDAKMLASQIQVQYSKTKTANIEVSNNNGGAIAIPDTRTNSVLVAGLKEDILMVEEAIKALDKPLRQVAIEVSLIEVSRDDTSNLGLSTATKGGKYNSGFNSPAQNLLGGLSSTANQAILGFDTANNLSQQIAVQLNALIQNNKAKLLANPTIMALDNSESLIKITDQVVSKMDVVVNQTSTSYSVTLADVGIVLNILPKIGDDGFVTMRIRPSITTPLAEKAVGSFGAYVTPISTREIIIQDVRVQSGETLAIAGILKESDIEKIGSVPIISELPVLGKLFRSKDFSHIKNELVILITPKIAEENI